MFQLINSTTVKLMHINVRTEKHGPADVDAVDLDLHLIGENRVVLGLLHPGLCEALYHNAAGDAGQKTIEGAPDSLPNLRFGKLGDALNWEEEETGVDLTVIYGVGDDKSNIKLEDGKAAVKRFEPKEGGSCALVFRYSVAGYPDGVIDKLRKKLKQELSITMVRPERLRRDAIDGTKGPSVPDGQGALTLGTSGPEDDDDSGGAADARPAGKTRGKGRRAAKDATDAFIEAAGVDAAGTGAAAA